MVSKDGGWQSVSKPSKGPSTNIFGFKEDEVERRKASYTNRDATKAVHPPPSFARFCETRISSKNIFWLRFPVVCHIEYVVT